MDYDAVIKNIFNIQAGLLSKEVYCTTIYLLIFVQIFNLAQDLFADRTIKPNLSTLVTIHVILIAQYGQHYPATIVFWTHITNKRLHIDLYITALTDVILQANLTDHSNSCNYHGS